MHAQTKICIYFLQPSGCPYGDRCLYAHGALEMREDMAGGTPSLDIVENPKLKTRMCRHWLSSNGTSCPHGTLLVWFFVAQVLYHHSRLEYVSLERTPALHMVCLCVRGVVGLLVPVLVLNRLLCVCVHDYRYVSRPRLPLSSHFPLCAVCRHSVHVCARPQRDGSVHQSTRHQATHPNSYQHQ